MFFLFGKMHSIMHGNNNRGCYRSNISAQKRFIAQREVREKSWELNACKFKNQSNPWKNNCRIQLKIKIKAQKESWESKSEIDSKEASQKKESSILLPLATWNKQIFDFIHFSLASWTFRNVKIIVTHICVNNWLLFRVKYVGCDNFTTDNVQAHQREYYKYAFVRF